MREKLAQIGPPPGLSPWREKTVLLLRCGDIDKDEFRRRVSALQRNIEALFEQSLPEAMEKETYLAAREYYDTASEALDCYLSGLEALLVWSDSTDRSLLDASKLHFAKGDKFSEEVVLLAFEAQESFKEMDLELMRAHGLNPEGID